MKTSVVLKRIRNLTNLAGTYYAIWEYNKETQAFVCDRKQINILGPTQEEFSEEDIFNWFKSFPEFIEAFDELVQHQSTFDLTFRIERNSEYFWLRIIGTCCKQSSCIYGSVKNITQEINRDILHRNQNIEINSFEKGLEKFSIVARTDARGKITYANEEFCRLSQYSNSELIGLDHRIINSGFHPKEFFHEMWSCILKGENWRGVVKNKAKDGSFYWVDTIIIPIFNIHGVLKEVLSFRFNVTDIQEMKEENDQLKKQLEALNSKWI